MKQNAEVPMHTSTDKLVKITCQYNKNPIAIEDMQKLMEIAEDYKKVKNYVYARYGGIDGFSKLYPGYTVQNEMTKSGLREKLGMPSVYFYLAIFEALGDLKAQWSITKKQIMDRIRRHEEFSNEEKHYLRFLLKVDNALDDVLHNRQIMLTGKIGQEYEHCKEQIDVNRLHHYLRRQVRKYLPRLRTEKADSFSIGERAYRYDDNGIYISIKQKRQRIFVPLTDGNRYARQLRIILFPEERRLEIRVPIDVKIRRHADYVQETGVALGIHTMLTTSDGNTYGEELGRYLTEKADWLRRENSQYAKQRMIDSNPIGRKKHEEQKKKIDEKIHSYINQEINRFVRTEKPAMVYLAKLPPNSYGGNYQSANYITTIWERGYIRKRFIQKCREQNIQVEEVFGKNISTLCSSCGKNGKKRNGKFICSTCGMEINEKQNTARNTLQRGKDGHKQKLKDK